MKQEIWRNYPLGSKVELVERLLERGVLHDEARAAEEPPARTLLRHGVQRAGPAHHGAAARAQALIDASRSSGCTISSRASRQVAPRFSMACQRGFCRRSLPQRFEHARVGRLAGGQQGGVGRLGGADSSCMRLAALSAGVQVSSGASQQYSTASARFSILRQRAQQAPRSRTWPCCVAQE